MIRWATALAVAAMIASPVAAGEPDYVDDRSTPQAVISSFYNAVERREYARAWSYYQDGEGVAPFEKFVAGYADTMAVSIRFGRSAQEGAAGSTYYTQPVYLDVTNRDGSHAQYGGCYTLRLANPANQAEPPFRPLHIVAGKLKYDRGEANFAAARCDP
ncbi:MAG: hypothetical protein Q7T08_13720 [Devosia sp.]|nr:hypothetical protein [Devosia sp.]